MVAFYGDSGNGETNEQAQWRKSTGIRIVLDTQSTSEEIIIGLVDYISLEAAEITNSWYFDVVIMAVFGFKSASLSGQSFIGHPKTREETQTAFENYLNQIQHSNRKWDITTFCEGKTYHKDGEVPQKFVIIRDGEALNMGFLPVNENPSGPSDSPSPKSAKESSPKPQNKPLGKPWWKFW
ncbi:MAG: hypothetical protein H6581_28295 [Bacteroidia bacterium]|nr:hypothetical protein [Bacteroidia bacterium]